MLAAAVLLVASPALMLAPPAAASARRLAQPVMQFGALGGQTPFAPLGTAGGASSAAASGSSALGQSEVAATGEVVKKGKKRKFDPNTGMLDQDRHSPDNSGVSHVPVPSPYHVFEPRMVRSPCAAPCTLHHVAHYGVLHVPSRCIARASRGAAHEHHRPPPPPALALTSILPFAPSHPSVRPHPHLRLHLCPQHFPLASPHCRALTSRSGSNARSSPSHSPPRPPPGTATPPVRHHAPPRSKSSRSPSPSPSWRGLALSRSPTRPPPPLPRGGAATLERRPGQGVATLAGPRPPPARLEPQLQP